MKIIDAHLHLFPESKAWAEEMARNVGHHNSTEHLRQVYRELGIVHGVVMGNHSLETGEAPGPGDLFHYCVGLDGSLLDEEGRPPQDLAEQVEVQLRHQALPGI